MKILNKLRESSTMVALGIIGLGLGALSLNINATVGKILIGAGIIGAVLSLFGKKRI